MAEFVKKPFFPVQWEEQITGKDEYHYGKQLEKEMQQRIMKRKPFTMQVSGLGQFGQISSAVSVFMASLLLIGSVGGALYLFRRKS